MKITLFQSDTVWKRPQDNYLQIEAQLEAHRDSDLLVMPEMCTTGFVTDPMDGELERSQDVEERLAALSQRFETALCGSFAVREPGLGGIWHNYNRCLFVTPEGGIWRYDKHHLFNPGGEGTAYTPGTRQVTARWKGVRFALSVCYDLRFPVWLKYHRGGERQRPVGPAEISPAHEYDVLICCANWPIQRQLAWETLIRARAIENQVYVVGVNRVGHDNICPYSGGSKVIHPYGHVISECQDNVVSTCDFEPDPEWLNHFREKFPSLRDSDSFRIW